MNKRDFISIDDLAWDALDGMLSRAAELKDDPASGSTLLGGKQVALIFERPSTRTRVSAEVAVSSMGGHPVVLRGSEMQLDRGESIEDTGRTLSRYVSAIIVRTSEHSRVERLAESASVPVINALSDSEHPCQALSDLFTIRERLGGLSGVRLAYVGDGNNVAHSLMLAGCLAGMNVVVASPRGYEPSATYIDRCHEIVAASGGSVLVTEDPAQAVEGARVVYTDVWASMGRDDEAEERAERFATYQVDQSLLRDAADDAIVMHCLPAHRGSEITSDVLDGPRSVVWDQAENRLHVQKAILEWALALDHA
jgi:ornithine carbamoyltransferase